MLYAVMAPEVGGETAFADMVAAYAALDEETQRQIEPLEAMHFYGAASGRDGENKASALLADQRRAVPPVPHRLVRRHPVTGHKALYAVAGTPFSVKGMDDAAAAALLERLKRHALQPRFTSKYKYSVGDIAIWDTLSTLHSATPIKPATGPNDSRLLWRISCKGLPTGFAARPADRAA
jgi:alpha-ketoglutarate-dependent taurine dioxygenase